MDTPAECVARAAEDEIAAVEAVLPNERSRLERSAFACRLRAEIIERLHPLRNGRGT